MCNIKRKRSPNWLSSEKLLLIDLVEKHYSVIENKKTDGVSMKTKLAEWQIIRNEYNSHTSHCRREAENLKAQWENMKKAAKKEASNARIDKIKTGGGPSNVKEQDPIYAKILALINTSAFGLYNPFDSDSVVPVENESNSAAIAIVDTENLLESNCNADVIDTDQLMPTLKDHCTNETGTTSMEYELHKDWGNYTPQLLRTPLSTQLRTNFDSENNKMGKKCWTSKRRPTHTSTSSSSLEKLHQKKIEAIDLQKKLACEEMEKNNAIKDLEIQIKEKVLKQDKIKTRILLLELKQKRNMNKNNN